MKRTTHWLVGETALSETDRDHCRMCGAEVGREHEEGCVLRRRTVVMSYTVEVVVAVPEHDPPKKIMEYYAGKCGSQIVLLLNLLQDRKVAAGLDKDTALNTVRQLLLEAQHRMSPEEKCFCKAVTVRFVREATPQDEEAQVRRVNDLAS